jgi:DNA-binding NtrC family response regulator
MKSTNENSTILIVDDEKNICTLLSRLLRKEGLETMEAYEGNTAVKMIVSQKPDVVLVDFRMPGMNGMELLKRAKELDQDLPIVMITAYADLKGAVEAMRAGAHDYLAKPFGNLEVIRVVYRALEERKLKRKLSNLTSELQGNLSLSTSMGTSDAVYQLLCKATQVAKSDFSVLIQGETGSGKELVARAIHDASPRSKKPFVPVDCGAIPETLLESELFGHEKGAFTGADYPKPGKFEATKGGTLFLDEISNMPLSSQAKLLRVLQEKKVYRVGSTKPIAVDVRLLVASNKDLFSLTESDSFRSDLFFRLNEFTITVPPLRERGEDIPYLAKRFLDITNIELNKHVKGFSESAMETLLGYNWPGNVRQFRSTIRRAVLLADTIITEKELDLRDVPGSSSMPRPHIKGIAIGALSLKEIVHDNILAVEREVITKVFQYTGGNKAKAARLLKIDYKTMHIKIKQLGISIDGGVYE